MTPTLCFFYGIYLFCRSNLADPFSASHLGNLFSDVFKKGYLVCVYSMNLCKNTSRYNKGISDNIISKPPWILFYCVYFYIQYSK